MKKEYENYDFYGGIKASLPYFLAALGMAIIGSSMINSFYPTIIQTHILFNPSLWRMDSIFKFLLVSVGIGWILHGVGFMIVKT
jgi:hypothetical protein|tara:strand:+ start:9072 stop:9323 length:252 start_codon:yes stop_codon:yes gene_type:complete